jgi:hypothetical protein
LKRTRVKPKFTQHQIDTALQVLMESKLVRNWALGELHAYGLDENTTAGAKFLLEKTKEIALKIIS